MDGKIVFLACRLKRRTLSSIDYIEQFGPQHVVFFLVVRFDDVRQ